MNRKPQDLPAFPERCDSGYDISGLTKRELFAAMMLNGILAGCPYGINSEDIDAKIFKAWAGCAIQSADALIAELNKPQTT